MLYEIYQHNPFLWKKQGTHSPCKCWFLWERKGTKVSFTKHLRAKCCTIRFNCILSQIKLWVRSYLAPGFIVIKWKQPAPGPRSVQLWNLSLFVTPSSNLKMIVPILPYEKEPNLNFSSKTKQINPTTCPPTGRFCQLAHCFFCLLLIFKMNWRSHTKSSILKS